MSFYQIFCKNSKSLFEANPPPLPSHHATHPRVQDGDGANQNWLMQPIDFFFPAVARVGTEKCACHRIATQVSSYSKKSMAKAPVI